jgi:hypothetical protein
MALSIRQSITVTIAFALVAAMAGVAMAALDYSAADPQLKIERLDSSLKESFLAVRVDSAGRIFVGGREAASFMA